MLCAMCISIFAADPGDSTFPTVRGPHHASITDMKAAAQQGCYLCSEVILDYEEESEDDNVKRLSNDLDDNLVSYELKFYILTSPTARLGVLSFQSADERLNSASYDIVYTENLEKPSDYDTYMRLAKADLSKEPWRVRDDGFASSIAEVPKSTGDPEVLKVAGRWLKQCLEVHSECEEFHPSSSAPWFPKRLLDLSGQSGLPRVIVTADEPPDQRYATLSHCWGKQPICTLTADNIDEWREGIPIEVLTRTFSDAIAATRMLNMRYLWIDSLCILQAGEGSTEDWQEHAVAMRLVYTNSLLNIAAARAESGADGAFASRPDTFLRPCHVLWKWPANFYEYSSDPFWTIRKSERHASFSIRTLPLYTRGWVVQERFLAPRVLHFGKDRIFWECNELPMAEESFPDGFRNSCPEYDNVLQWPFNLHDQLRELSGTSSLGTRTGDPIWIAWQTMINEYARCDLSFPDKDIFIAMAGIAERFGQYYDHQYIAGHFRQHLPFDLLWQNRGERSEDYRAPSWSWAGIDEGVRLAIGDCPYCDKCCNRFASVKEFRVDLVNEKIIYGQVRYAELTLTGYLIPCLIEPTTRVGTGLRQRVAIFIGRASNDSNPPGPAAYKNTSIVWGEADLDDEDDSLRGFASTSHFMAWVLPIMEFKPESTDEMDMHRGLVLKNAVEGKYERVGIYQVRNHMMHKVLQEPCRVEEDICLV